MAESKQTRPRTGHSWRRLPDRLVWVSLLGLTAGLLSFPVQVHYLPYYIASNAGIFGPYLVPFAIAFVLWFALMMYELAFMERSRARDMALVVLFSSVFFGFWVLNAPNGTEVDSFNHLGLVQHVLSTGSVAYSSVMMNYLSFPSFFIVNAAVSEVSGLGASHLMPVFMIFSEDLLGVGLYLLFKKFLDSRWSVLSAFMVLMGADMARVQVYGAPGLSYIFLLFLLSLVLDVKDGRKLLIFFVILPAFVLSYLPWPAYFGVFVPILIAVSYYRRLIRLLPYLLVLGAFLAAFYLFALVPYVGSRSTSGIVSNLGITFNGNLFSTAIRTITGGLSITSALVLYVRLAWSTVIYGGGLVAILALLRARGGPVRSFLISGVLSVIAYSAVLLVAFGGTSGYAAALSLNEWTRFLQLAPLFLLPGLALTFSRPAPKGKRRLLFPSLVVLTLVLAFPSFLVFTPSYQSQVVYPYDVSAVSSATHAIPASPFDIYTSSGDSALFGPYLGTANFTTVVIPLLSTADSALASASRAVARFQDARQGSMFVLSEDYIPTGYNLTVHLAAQLQENDLVYSNGHVWFYLR